MQLAWMHLAWMCNVCFKGREAKSATKTWSLEPSETLAWQPHKLAKKSHPYLCISRPKYWYCMMKHSSRSCSNFLLGIHLYWRTNDETVTNSSHSRFPSIKNSPLSSSHGSQHAVPSSQWPLLQKVNYCCSVPHTAKPNPASGWWLLKAGRESLYIHHALIIKLGILRGETTCLPFGAWKICVAHMGKWW